MKKVGKNLERHIEKLEAKSGHGQRLYIAVRLAYGQTAREAEKQLRLKSKIAPGDQVAYFSPFVPDGGKEAYVAAVTPRVGGA